MKYRIGKTIAVQGDTIEMLLEEPRRDAEGIESGVPANMTVAFDQPPRSLVIGQPGSFVEMAIPTGGLLGVVIACRLLDPTKAFQESSIGARVLEALAIGTLDRQGRFDRGSDVLPTVGMDVYAVAPESLQAMYASDEHATVAIGKLSYLPSQDAKINLDSLLSRHAAIVGQTGAGKSWTVASLLQRIAAFPQSTVILLDLHGEYGRAFGSYATNISAAELELPYWLMNAEELMDVCIERHETGAPLQIAKFKELLQAAKSTNRDNAALKLPKISLDTPVYFDFQRFIEELQRLDTELVLVNLIRTHGPLYGMFTKTILRIQSRLNDRRFDLIFNPKTYKDSVSMEALFRRILGEETAPKKLVTLDLSQVPFDVRSSVISLILRCLFDFAYWYKRKHGNAYPISVFCDEAHTYLNDADAGHRASRLSAERIAKEGRKYGVSLTAITQRPREVSSTILSQCNSFMCLRISNPDDQQYVRNLLPDSMKGIVSMISTLRRGEALVVGDAVMMPTRVKIFPPDPKPDSADVSFTTRWSKAHAEVDVGGVVTMWRREGA